ncbi:transposase [Nonomuraea sp. M3C6]|uniref:Transposase n=1 Tax=Nonomuraea marmarensis TaxID=3351344 RepID=A0ABW7ANL9_9ACTN
MTTNPDAVAAGATVAYERWPVCFEDLMDRIAACFGRRETRLTCRNMVEAVLTVTESANCWTLAEEIGHRGPHVLHHFLSRARWNHDAVRERVAAWAVEQLGEQQVVLVVDETGDEKSSTDAVGAARQYSGALGSCISISARWMSAGARLEYECPSIPQRSRCWPTGQVRSDPAALG